MSNIENLASGSAAVLFAAIFLFGEHIHPLRFLFRDDRGATSLGAGISTGYVFVHLMPELHEARRSFAESASVPLKYEGMAIYFLSLIGFLVFYGLEHLRRHLRSRLRKTAVSGQTSTAFKIDVGGFAAYVWIMAYLLVHNLEGTMISIAPYTLAIAVHFLGVDRILREEHGAAYDRIGRFVLGGMALLGWSAGLLFALPHPALAMLVAFVSGAVIINGAIMELPSDKDGRFIPFMIGGLVYGLILLPLG